LYSLLALLILLFITSEIGSCGDESQNSSSGASIVLKDNNSSGISINIKDKTQFHERISGTATQNTAPKVVLNVNPSPDNASPSSTIQTVQGNDKKSNPAGKLQSTLIVPVQTPSTTSINVAPSQFPKPLIAPRSILPRKSSEPKVELVTPSSKSSKDHLVIDLPPKTSQPTIQSIVPPVTNSKPKPKPSAQIVAQQAVPPATPKPAAKIIAQQTVPPVTPQPAVQIVAQRLAPPVTYQPAAQIVAQQAVPPVTPQPTAQKVAQQAVPPIAAKPVSLNVNPQVLPAPPPQLAMAPPVRPVKRTDSENKKDNGGQSNQLPVPAQETRPLPQPPSVEGVAPQGDNATPSTPSNRSDQKLGEAPPDTHLEFLRQQTVLLKPCEWQMDVGFTYLHSDSTFTDIILPNQLVEARIRQRLLFMPLEVRYGLFERVQLFANAPFGWANTEVSHIGADDFTNNGGIGDTNAGATILLHKSDGTSCSPDVLATFGLTAPTGRTNGFVGIVESPGTTLGQGFWAGYWSVLAIHTYDPVVVFYGVGSRHCFTKDIDGIPAKPGDQYIYQLGTGFAINERVTLSTTFFGSYITEARVNNHIVQGTILEPMYLRFAVTITRPNKRIIEPFATIGMTDAAANAQAGITWTF
jgi:hypothetical protein